MVSILDCFYIKGLSIPDCAHLMLTQRKMMLTQRKMMLTQRKMMLTQRK
jgi:hypothetical protein